MKRVINLGKVDYLGHGRKDCPVTIEIEIRERTGKSFIDGKEGTFKVLSICGTIWNHIRSDCYSGGQNIDTIAELIRTKRVKRIEEIWERYHLNDMKAGSREQVEAIREWREQNGIKGWAYEQECEYLKGTGKYELNGFKWGHGWWVEEIPEDILKEIESI